MSSTRRHRSPRGNAGFTFIEVMLGLIVLLMMTLMFAAVFPMTVRAAKFSNNYAQASLLAQHKIDQMRGAGYDQIAPTSTNFTSLQTNKVIDTAGTAPTALPYAVSFTNVDVLPDTNTPGAQGFFPAGSTGIIIVSDYSSSASVTLPDGSNTVYTPAGSSTVAAGNVDLVTVIITWPGLSGTAGQYKATALIAPH